MRLKDNDIKKLIKNFGEGGLSEFSRRELDQFLIRYAPEKLKDLKEEEYALGIGKDTFCYKIEWSLLELGSNRGSVASKYGFWFSQSKNDYCSAKKFGGNGKEDFENVKAELIRVIKHAIGLNSFSDIESKLSPVFKHKVMYVYNREIMLPIYSEEHLDYYIDFFGKQYQRTYEQKQRTLLEVKKRFAPNWDNQKFMAFLYRYIWPQRYSDDIYDKQEKDVDYDPNASEELSLPHKPKGLKTENGVSYYQRDAKEASKALKRCRLKCEMDENHKSFISARTGQRYLECHHLIPMSEQHEYEYSIDVAQNIVCLCSDCHNRIHYGKDRDRLIEKLYNERKEMLSEYGIKISLGKLKSFYK